MNRTLLALLLLPSIASAHQAETGWNYDYVCCSDKDCRQIATDRVQITNGGFYVEINDETIPFSDRRIKQSKDDKYHLCTIGGMEKTKALCLYVPPFGF